MFGKTFFGGVHPHDFKELSAGQAIEVLPEPDVAVIPLQQHIGAPSKAIVQKGDTVTAGQPLSEPGGFVSVPVHASISGTVKEIKPYPHPLGTMVQSVVIERDPEAAPVTFDEKKSWDNTPVKELVEAVHNAGIAGMGGATFPTHVKLSPPPEKAIDTLILNGVECEPYLTSDYRMMLEKGEGIIEGMKILARILGPENIIIGIEANKPDAIARLSKLAEGTGIRVESLKVKYPQGAEKQLIYSLTKREVPSGGLPMDVGCLVQNAGTAYAIYEAVVSGKPLIERVVTVTGSGINQPRNLLAKIGTPAAALFEACGGVKDTTRKIISGGPMMGMAQFSIEAPVIKGTSGLLLLDEKDARQFIPGTCIACGRCVDACPMKLVPTRIAREVEAGKTEEAAAFGLMDCIECGCCTYICPAKIDIVHQVKLGKARAAAARKK